MHQKNFLKKESSCPHSFLDLMFTFAALKIRTDFISYSPDSGARPYKPALSSEILGVQAWLQQKIMVEKLWGICEELLLTVRFMEATCLLVSIANIITLIAE